MSQTPAYQVSALFYKNAAGQDCRKYLDIKEIGINADKPELVVVMLNPGSCGEHDLIVYDKEIPVKADATLYRVQGFMREQGLKWARVLNLSDIREKSSQQFFRMLGPIGDGQIPEHSLFHPYRAEELNNYVPGKTPFLFAWGLDARCRKLATSVVARIKEHGYPIVNEQGPHYHPLVWPTDTIPVWQKTANEAYRTFFEKVATDKSNEKGDERDSIEDRIRFAFKFFTKFAIKMPIITEAKGPGRWELFAHLLQQKGLKPFIGTENYDYVYVDNVPNAKAFYELLEQHNGKQVIVDAAASPEILRMKGGIELLEGAVCSSPDSGAKWKVGQGYDISGKPGFTFSGKLVLLVNQTAAELRKDKRFAYLVRDCMIV